MLARCNVTCRAHETTLGDRPRTQTSRVSNPASPDEEISLPDGVEAGSESSNSEEEVDGCRSPSALEVPAADPRYTVPAVHRGPTA